MMITITKILGMASDAAVAGKLHDLEHHGRVERLIVERGDTLRRRLRGTTDKGTEVAIALDRKEQLADGSVLVLDRDRAIVVRMSEERWLRIVPCNTDAALEAGYAIGNLHWRVRFEAGAILVALEGPREHYVARLEHLVHGGRIRIGGDE